MPTVTSRIVAEIHRGIDFPAGWADKPDMLNIGMALDTIFSVAAMFDSKNQPVALCWCIGDGEEKFLCADSIAGHDTSLVDALNDDLARESRRIGIEDLFGTLVWAPDDFRPDQGQVVRRTNFAPGFPGLSNGAVYTWNVPPATMVAKAAQLLLLTRAVDENLAFPMPISLDAMHRQMGKSDPQVLVVLPGSVAVPPETDVNMKLALFFGALVVAGALISAWLSAHG